MKTEITQYIHGNCKRCEQWGLINEHGFCVDCAMLLSGWRKN